VKPKILVVLYHDETTWLSCLKINRGLLELYQEIGEVKICYLKDSTLDYYIVQDHLLDFCPDVLVSFDHRISPSKLVSYIKGNPRLSEFQTKLTTIIHLFGDIKLLKKDLLAFDQIARGLKIKLVLPCESRLNSFSFLSVKKGICSLVPCVFDKELNNTIKKYKRTGPSGSPLKIGYLGRISRLKNILPMLEIFRPYIEKNEIEFHLAGPFDDFEKQDITLGTGFYMKQVLDYIGHKPGIHYHGVKKGDQEVYSFLNSLDGVCVLSTHGGEDFCFAVYEALSIGVPCFLNQWMGLKDHEKRSALVTSTNFKLLPNGELDKDSIDQNQVSAFLKECRKIHNTSEVIDPIEVRKSLVSLITSPSYEFEGFVPELREFTYE